MKRNTLSMLALVAPFLAACGGGGGGGSAVPGGANAAADRLCPASLDYNTVFTGGGGDGELVKMQIDTTKMTWQVTYVESAIPATTGTVSPSRAGTADAAAATPPPPSVVPLPIWRWGGRKERPRPRAKA